MNVPSTRRAFIRSSALASACVGLGDFAFLARLPGVSAAEAKLDPSAVLMDPAIEPLVRFLEETPRARLLEEMGQRIRDGLAYRDVLTALLLAGVRNIQPRPVGFKFHAVLVVNSAHLASLSSPDSDRWLPIFWALDYFKSAQRRDEQEGNWTMRPVDESKVPLAHQARSAFVRAMDTWDVEAADTAVVGLARSSGAHEVFELFSRYGARDFRDIGHKAIFVANAWRTLQCVGWHHAEPVLRSLAYALLNHEGDNPAKRDAPADRHGRRNLELITQIRPAWKDGALNPSATRDLIDALRNASSDQAADQTMELLNRGVAPQSIWDSMFTFAGELLMRRPGIISLHAVTSSNAIHYAYQAARDDASRRFLLLQNASFLSAFRGDPGLLKKIGLAEIEPGELSGEPATAAKRIFAEVSRDRLAAARLVRAYLRAHPQPKDLIDTARRLIFLKGTNSHDYKFSSAVLEDYYHISPEWRGIFLATSVFNLRGSGDPDNRLVQRTRSALGRI